MKEKEHTYSLELLYHFSCALCSKWWSVGDYDTIEQRCMTCPHCGHTTTIKK